MKKFKRAGICKREILVQEVKYENKVIQKEMLGHLILTEGAKRSAIRSALRKLWTSAPKRVFLESVRFQHDFGDKTKFAVKCVECSEIMSITDREFTKKKDGSPGKIKRVLYEVDHLIGSPGLEDIEQDLGEWAKWLLDGELQVLCRECHGKKTHG